MFEPASLLKLVHAFLGIWFVAALGGRWVALAVAARATELGGLKGALAVASRFERMVMIVPFFVLLMGIATAIAQGQPFLGPLQGAPINYLFVSIILFLSPLPLIPLVFLPRGRIFGAALADAETQGVVTEEVRTGFRDRVVFAGHTYELGSTLVVLTLMITKPF